METEARNNPVWFLFENQLSEKLFSKTLFGIVIYKHRFQDNANIFFLCFLEKGYFPLKKILKKSS